MPREKAQYNQKQIDLSSARGQDNPVRFLTPFDHLTVVRRCGPIEIRADDPEGKVLPLVGGQMHVPHVQQVFVSHPAALRAPRDLVLVNSQGFWTGPVLEEPVAPDPRFVAFRDDVGTASAGDIPAFGIIPDNANRVIEVQKLQVRLNSPGVIDLFWGGSQVIASTTDEPVRGVSDDALAPGDSIVQPFSKDSGGLTISPGIPDGQVEVTNGGEWVTVTEAVGLKLIGRAFELIGPDAEEVDVRLQWTERVLPRDV